MKLPSLKWLGVIGASFSLVAILVLRSHYADWKTARLRKAAERALAHQQPVEASLDAAAGLQIRPGDPELTRLLGDAYDATNDERLLEVLHQQIQQDPGALDPQFRLARAALRFGRLDVSVAAINAMPASASATVDFHEISSALATVSKRGSKLFDHARQLHNLEPQKPDHVFKLAGLAILAHSALRLEAGELAKLRELRAETSSAANATILLWGISRLNDYRGDDADALERDLMATLALDSTTFETRIQTLDLAGAIGQQSTAEAIFTLLKNHASTAHDLAETGVLLAWLNTKGDPADALAWARELGLLSGDKPASTLASVLADTCARTSAWQELEWLVTGTDWGQGDFIRHFYAAKCAAERPPSPTTKIERESFLRLALKGSEANPAHVQLLWQTAMKYHWRDLAQPLSWALAERTRTIPERRSVLQSISTEALSAGDLAGFQRATTAMLEVSPGQWELRNNNYYASLLSGGCSPELLGEIEEFHREFIDHPDVSTTYALALHLSGRSDPAAEILLSLEEEIRSSASVAPFCELIFSAAGQQVLAERYRQLPQRLFFQEEKALLAALR